MPPPMPISYCPRMRGSLQKVISAPSFTISDDPSAFIPASGHHGTRSGDDQGSRLLLFIEIAGSVTKPGSLDLKANLTAGRPDKHHATVLHLVGDGDPSEILR